MKKIFILILFVAAAGAACSQAKPNDLPPEFKDVAVQAFQKIKPESKQWFIDAANQHPSGSFDTSWAKKKLREKFGADAVNISGELFMVMIAYQRMMNKEAREDRKIASASKQQQLAAKDNKLKLDNEKIDQSKKEADEKQGHLMDAANANLWIGVVQGLIQIGAATTSYGGNNNSSVQTNQIKSSARISPTTVQKIDSSKLKVKNANVNQQTQQEEREKNKAQDELATSKDHQKAMKDAVKKLLDQMAEINRSVKL